MLVTQASQTQVMKRYFLEPCLFILETIYMYIYGILIFLFFHRNLHREEQIPILTIILM